MVAVGPPPVFFWILAGVMAAIAILSFFVALTASGRGNTPDRCWKGGIFYVNPEDNSLFVPKRSGLGYTLNFAHPRSWWVLAGIIVVTLVPLVFALCAIHRGAALHR
jgi:hypothetical protein